MSVGRLCRATTTFSRRLCWHRSIPVHRLCQCTTASVRRFCRATAPPVRRLRRYAALSLSMGRSIQVSLFAGYRHTCTPPLSKHSHVHRSPTFIGVLAPNNAFVGLRPHPHITFVGLQAHWHVAFAGLRPRPRAAFVGKPPRPHVASIGTRQRLCSWRDPPYVLCLRNAGPDLSAHP